MQHFPQLKTAVQRLLELMSADIYTDAPECRDVLSRLVDQQQDVANLLAVIEQQPPRIVVVVEGGVAQMVLADAENVDVIVVDYDTEHATDDEITIVPQSDPDKTAPAVVAWHTAEYNRDWVKAVFATQEGETKETVEL